MNLNVAAQYNIKAKERDRQCQRCGETGTEGFQKGKACSVRCNMPEAACHGGIVH